MKAAPYAPASPRNSTKAIVRREEKDGRSIVVKDYSSRSLWVRLLYGRPSLRREARTYRRLRGLSGIPECLGFQGPDKLLLEYVDARNLRDFRPGDLHPAVFDRLDDLLQRIHARGVAIADLHRSNVLVSDDGRVFLIDFAFARMSADQRAPGWWVESWQKLDRHAAARLRSRFLGSPVPKPTGLFGFFYRSLRKIKPGREKTTIP